MRSLQDNVFGNRWVGSDISWYNPCIVVSESMAVPSCYVMSSDHHHLDLTLKLHIVTVKDILSPLTKLSRFSKFDKNLSNSTVDWLVYW